MHLKTRLAPLAAASERHLLPLALLLLRLKVGAVFLLDGWLKLGYALHHETDSLYALFDSYKVPLLPVKVAAWACVTGELAFGLMLALGLFARLGALGLIVISGVIYLTDDDPLASYWTLICALIAAGGPGRWSLDAWIFKNKKSFSHES